jgi:hypothetical protein
MSAICAVQAYVCEILHKAQLGLAISVGDGESKESGGLTHMLHASPVNIRASC